MYKVLPFGLKDSPWVFSRLVATVIAHLRLQGIRIFFYLDDWLIVRRGPQSVPSVTSSNHSSVGSESGVHCQSKESRCFTPSEDARLPRSFSRYPQVNCASGRTQSFGSSVAHPGTRRVSGRFPAPPVAESSRTFGQPCGSGFQIAGFSCGPLQLHFLRFFTPLLDSQSEADSDVSRNQGSVCSLGVSGFVSSKGNRFSPTPPTPWY